jgi:hypothetical protein
VTPTTAIVSNYLVFAGTNNHQFKLYCKKIKANNPRKKIKNRQLLNLNIFNLNQKAQQQPPPTYSVTAAAITAQCNNTTPSPPAAFVAS